MIPDPPARLLSRRSASPGHLLYVLPGSGESDFSNTGRAGTLLSSPLPEEISLVILNN